MQNLGLESMAMVQNYWQMENYFGSKQTNKQITTKLFIAEYSCACGMQNDKITW